ncbi:MAG: AAA family ATPase [Sphingobacteriia bacterium]|nr:AAA family ATPase [Sphingobacteriia bacterium]NCC39878.1 AAA family ATPase [Gammaproteobacteria bacterium]
MINQRQLLELLKPLLEPIQEGVIITDRHGNPLVHNQAVTRLFGLAQASGALSLTRLGTYNLRAALIRAGLGQAQGDQHHCEASVQFDEEINVDGAPRWLRIDSNLVSLNGKDHQLRMIRLRDITAERRLSAVMQDQGSLDFVARDPDMIRLVERLNLVAGSDAAVLLQGESGTGKTELARLLHRRSRRAERPFVEVNCGSIPASLIETELFGHVKGAFTGAYKDRLGRFKAAHGGTLFLDEIGELPRELQPKLLRVLQDGGYEAVGSDRTLKVDVRLVAASNRDLRELVDRGEFRSDLYYRIAVVKLQVPPLRERPGDIPLLIEAILKRLEMRGYPGGLELNREAFNAFMNYPWPGNVRELANAVEHSVICATEGQIAPDSLPDCMRDYCAARRQRDPVAEDSETSERTRIALALHQAAGNKTLAAQILGMDRSTLWRRMQRLSMD